ncbi:MAG: RHS repeat-associated core domain-containing protein [Bacteroidota bacterium]
MKTSFSYDWPFIRSATTVLSPLGLRLCCRLGVLGVLLLCSQLAEAQLIGGRGDGQPSPSEVKPTAVTAGGFSGDVSLFTGTYNTSYHLGTVTHPSGLSYTANLSYSSTFASGNNLPHTSGVPYGEGWTVDLPMISISTETYNKYSIQQIYTMKQNCGSGGICTPTFNNGVNCEEAKEEGDLHWFAPMLNIPGVVSGRMVYKRYDSNGTYIFTLHTFDRYVEAHFRGGEEWEIILDDGTRYLMTAAMVSHVNSSNQRIQDDCSRDLDAQANVMLPRSTFINWYCTRIHNRSLTGTIRFQYETFGCFDYYKEFAQPKVLDAINYYFSIGQYDAVPLRTICKDIIIKEIRASNLERLVFDYDNIPTAGSVNLLNPADPDVTSVDAMYSSKVIKEWQGQDFNLWYQYRHMKSPDFGTNINNHLINPLNPYKAKIGESDFYYRTDNQFDIHGLPFKHSYLESPRVGKVEDGDMPSGDTYKVELEIKNTEPQGFHPTCLFDINLATGDQKDVGLTFPGFIDANCYERTTSQSVASSFNQSVKWVSGDASNAGLTQIEHTFVMPNNPAHFEGFNIQVGPANADLDHSTDRIDMISCGSGGPIYPAVPYVTNAYFTENNPATDYNAQKALYSGDPVPSNFGVGAPWYLANDFYGVIDPDINFLANGCGSNTARNFWWNDQVVNPDYSNIPTLSHHIAPDDPLYNVPYLFLSNAKITRIAKNPYMLKSVTKLVFAGGASIPEVLEEGVWHEQSVLHFEYDFEVVDRYVSTESPDGMSQLDSYYKDQRNVVVLKKIRRMPIDGTLSSLDDAPTTHLEYAPLGQWNNTPSTPLDPYAPLSYTRYNSNFVLLEKITDEIGREIELDYASLGDPETGGGVSTAGSTSYTLIGYNYRPRPAELNGPSGGGCGSTVGKVLPYSYQTYMVVDKMKIRDRTSWKEWDYTFSDFEAYSDDIPLPENYAYDPTSSVKGGFGTSEVLGPDNNGARLRTKIYHYTNEDASLLWGKLYKQEQYDAAGLLEQEQTTDYEIVLAFESPTNRFTFPNYDYEEYYTFWGKPTIAPQDYFNSTNLQTYYGLVDTWGTSTSTNYSIDIGGRSPDINSITSGYKAANSFDFREVSHLEGSRATYLNSYFIKKTREESKVFDNTCPGSDSLNNHIHTITEYEYFDANYRGRSSSGGYGALGALVDQGEYLLQWEPSWQLYRRKSYSPQLPNAFTEEEYFYFYDLANVSTYQDVSNNYRVNPNFKILHDIFEFKKVRGLPFQKRVSQRGGSGGTHVASTFYEYHDDWENNRAPVTIETVDNGVTWPCDGGDILTGGTGGGGNNIPNEDPCIIVKGDTPVPDLSIYCPHPTIPYLYCPCSRSTGTDPGDYWDDYDNAIAANTNPYDDPDIAAYANNTLMGKIMLHKVLQQVASGNGVLTFDPTGQAFTPDYPVNTLVVQTIEERNEFGQIALERNERDLLTRYHYGDLHIIQYKDCIDGYEALIRVVLNNNPALPDSVTVGWGRSDRLITKYDYWPHNAVWKVDDPNGTELRYTYDNFGRLTESFRNGDQLQKVEYSFWDNQIQGFSARANQNFVNTTNWVTADSSWQERTFVDPLGREIAVLRDGNEHLSNTLYDNWDRPSVQFKPIASTTGQPIVDLPVNFDPTVHSQFLYEDRHSGRMLKSSKNGEDINGTHIVTNDYCLVSATVLQADLATAQQTAFVPAGSVFFKTTITDEDGKPIVEYSNAIGQKVASISNYGLSATTFLYNAQGNLVETYNPNGQVSEYDYNYLGQLFYRSTVDDGETDYGYDQSGLLIGERDANNAIRLYEYDAHGRTTRQARTFSGNGIVVFSTDGAHWVNNRDMTLYKSLFSSTQTRLEKRWFYHDTYNDGTPDDPALVALFEPNASSHLLGDVTYSEGRLTLAISYDLLGKPVEMRSFSYDEDGFMKWEMSQFNYLGITASSPGHSVKIDYPLYDFLGNNRQQYVDLNANGSHDYRFAYNYNRKSQLSEVYVNNGIDNQAYKIADFHYWALTDQLKFKRYFDSEGPTCKDVMVDNMLYLYDDRFRLTNMYSHLYDQYLYYDNNHFADHLINQSSNYNGNINTNRGVYKLNNAVNDPGNFTGTFAYNYKYDGQNRLISAQGYDNAPGDFGGVIYSYDKIGNFRQLFRWGRDASSNLHLDRYTYAYQPGNNRLYKVKNLGVGGAPQTPDRDITYDANGNVVTDTKLDIGLTKYGRANLPWEVIKGAYSRTIGYLYDANDQRIFKRESPGNLPPVIQKVFYLRDASGRELGVYDYLSGELEWMVYGSSRVAKIKHHTLDVLPDPGDLGGGGGGSTRSRAEGTSSASRSSTTNAPDLSFYVDDHLGNTRVVYTTNVCAHSGSSVVYTLQYAGDYYPYGKTLREFVNGAPERYLTTQHERDVETGLDYRGARFYDADIGRFLSLDPLAMEFPAWSDYNYVLGNPVRFIDPDGRSPENHDPFVIKTEVTASRNGEQLVTADVSISFQYSEELKTYDLSTATVSVSITSNEGSVISASGSFKDEQLTVTFQEGEVSNNSEKTTNSTVTDTYEYPSIEAGKGPIKGSTGGRTWKSETNTTETTTSSGKTQKSFSVKQKIALTATTVLYDGGPGIFHVKIGETGSRGVGISGNLTMKNEYLRREGRRVNIAAIKEYSKMRRVKATRHRGWGGSQ